jgi:hypothetical protein
MAELSSARWSGRHASTRPGQAYHPRVNDLIILLVVILVIVLIVRGPKTLPEIGRMFGRGVREAREEISKVRGPEDSSAAPDEPKS